MWLRKRGRRWFRSVRRVEQCQLARVGRYPMVVAVGRFLFPAVEPYPMAVAAGRYQFAKQDSPAAVRRGRPLRQTHSPAFASIEAGSVWEFVQATATARPKPHWLDGWLWIKGTLPLERLIPLNTVSW